MSNLLLSFLAILPGILICYFIYRFDKYEQESRLPLAVCFVLGGVSALCALKLEEWGDRLGIDENQGFWMLMLLSFVVIALSEELVKFIVLRFYPFSRPFFNEPLDGIIYAVMIGMGFATLENILYADRFGTSTTIVRAFTAVPAHAVFAIVMGYYVGLAKFDKKNSIKYLLTGLGLAVLIHGIYDVFILQQYYEWLMVFATFTLLLSGYFAYRLLRLHLQHSSSQNIIVAKESVEEIVIIEEFPLTSESEDPLSQSDVDIMDSIIKDTEEED